MTTLYIGAGSNKGDRLAHLRFARERLSLLLGNFRASSLYETAPRDYLDQDHFLNCVFSGTVLGEPEDFLDELQRLEKEAGRVREGAIPKGPRELDLDILLWGDRRIGTARLIVPHPAMKERAFVLVPLLELEENLVEPGTSVPYRDYLASLEDQGVKPVDFSVGMW
ncbi:MAG: 2-amino-4-hydroxy-6-hydroxymethyldihydropteridine diphosphokinase [Spirochaetales bacterium]|nr:2-amino-4-hydroxy-6-hydroxymethyldihydropteridine diphosphokinase [Spirochaetales bacterium]